MSCCLFLLQVLNCYVERCVFAACFFHVSDVIDGSVGRRDFCCSAGQAQVAIEGGLERRRRGVLGPPENCVACIFVDDLSMPLPEVSSAQPPVELLRQVRYPWRRRAYLCHVLPVALWLIHTGLACFFIDIWQVIECGGWYNRTDLNWQSLVDFVVLAAMSSQGASGHPVTPRLLRHMQIVGVAEQDDTALLRIFAIIMQTHMKRGNFSSEVSGLARSVMFAATTWLTVRGGDLSWWGMLRWFFRGSACHGDASVVSALCPGLATHPSEEPLLVQCPGFLPSHFGSNAATRQ
jgi:hypothetical protein